MSRSVKSPLSSVFVSDAVLQIIAHVSLNTNAPFAAIKSSVDISERTLRQEVKRLVDLGILAATPGPGRSLSYTLGSNSLVSNFSAIALAAYGPVPVLAREIGVLAGVEQVLIFGSWAARHQGVNGRLPNDIDVLVVGNVDRKDLYAATDAASSILGREISPRRVSSQSWNDQADPFLQEVANGPLVEVPVVASVKEE